jgi:hypothetical protein
MKDRLMFTLGMPPFMNYCSLSLITSYSEPIYASRIVLILRQQIEKGKYSAWVEIGKALIKSVVF